MAIGDNGFPLPSDGREWRALEDAAVHSAIAGGMAAMGYYRNALRTQDTLESNKNPSTLADVYATATILRTAHSLIAPTAARIGLALSYLAEETSDDEKKQMVADLLEDDIRARLHAPERFFGNTGLRVILDAIDGTGNFERGVPFFCSAVAVLLGKDVRVGAVYDPIHHEVYSGTLRGPAGHPEETADAWIWHVATGNRFPFPDSHALNGRPLDKEPVAVHLSRTKTDALHAILGVRESDNASMLERLSLASGGIYALNSGILAMAKVAQGSLGAFVNVATNRWDVAAGEVLVRASGGKVTDLKGKRLSYSTGGPVSVVAAKSHLHRKVLAVVRG